MPSYLTTSDVAVRLGVSLDTVRRWLRSGELKGTPFGRAGYRIEDRDFQDFLDQRRRKAQSSPFTNNSDHHPLLNLPLSTILDQVTHVYVALDLAWRYIYLNPAAEALLGYTPEECLGKNLHELVHYQRPDGSTFPIEECPFCRDMIHDSPIHLMEIVFWHKDGSALPALCSCSPLYDQGKIAGYIVFMLEKEREGQESNDIERRMGEFISVVSQELQTPLSTLKGTLQLANRLIQRVEPEASSMTDLLMKLQDLLSRAERQVGVETRLVGDLLDALRIETNTFALAPTWGNLVEIVRETTLRHVELAPQRRIELQLPGDELVPVIADAARISQVLTNYLTNALKFSPPDRPIIVRLEVLNSEARVAVQDQGRGLAPYEQQRAWESFYQGQRSGPGGGLGLGLYIAQAIIQQHHGKVGLESSLGEYTTFWFTLPIAEEMWR